MINLTELISIIIPVLNEENNIEGILQQVNRLVGNKEVIVVDGGSSDDTVNIAQRKADKVIISKKGRGQQLNKGVEYANGDILFFLHSDCTLKKDALLSINDVLKNKDVIGGCFRLKLDGRGLFYKYITWSSNLRARYLKLIFGDQGIFVRKDVFNEIKGFPNKPIMEDWDFSKKLSKHKGELVFLDDEIVSSVRKFEKNGKWKTFLLMQWIKILYTFGVKAEKIYEMYYN
ncbi:MAG: TIGR04283 family arsenosugar biosynthesis glycosyltransferase [Halanaerobiales bacterium]|nr:TIGR04283 family arsenosugar biosynthesis glycosyltransferase [Halanaerobiales bacterium]